jgi:hypothetical protein
MLGLAPDSALQLPLRFSAVIFFLMSLSVLCWPLRRSEQRAMVQAKLQHPIRWAADLLEPSHIIIFGLAIALGGVIWQMRATKPAIAGSSPTNRVVTTSAPVERLSDFGWGFERYPGYDFLGMSMAPDGQILVHQFQAKGHNNTKDPIVKVGGTVRSDRTNKEFPILFNLTDGKYLTSGQLNPVPVDAIIDTRAYFSDDETPIPLKQFLSDFVPFTFIFEYDGKTYRHRFTLADIEPRIQRYEQDMRKMSVKPPQMSARGETDAQKPASWRSSPTQAQDRPSVATPGIGSPPSPDQTDMKWNEIFGTTRGGGSMINLFLDGNGPPTKSIKLADAFLESAITGEVIKMKMGTSNMYDDPYPISEANPIPPKGFVRLVATVNEAAPAAGLPDKEFYERWGKIWFNAVYQEGKPDRIFFDMAGYFPWLSGPHATRKTDVKKD